MASEYEKILSLDVIQLFSLITLNLHFTYVKLCSVWLKHFVTQVRDTLRFIRAKHKMSSDFFVISGNV